MSTEATVCQRCGCPSHIHAVKVMRASKVARTRRAARRIGWAVAALVAVGLCAQDPDVTTKPTANTKTQPTPAPSWTPDVLQVGAWSWSQSYDHAIAEGQVTNISSDPLKNVRVHVTYTTSTGAFITSDDAMVDFNPILPGQTSSWKSYATWNPAMAKASVEFSTLWGGTLKVRR